jgi:hypothetical protein
LVAFLTKAGFELVDHHLNKEGTSLAARKVRKADYEQIIPMPENYQRLWDMFMQGTNAPQYAHKHPVKRAISKQYRYAGEFLIGLQLREPKAIVHHIYNQ